MTIVAQMSGLPADHLPYSVEVRAGLGLDVPRAVLHWRFADPSEVPAASSLMHARVEVALRRAEDVVEKPSFLGEVHRVRTRRLSSHRHELVVEAQTIPARLANNLFERASWRTYEQGTGLAEVMSGLLEDAGFEGVSPDPAPAGSIPGQFVAAGRSAWRLLGAIASLHGYAVVVRCDVPADAPNKVGFVDLGQALGGVGAAVPVGLGSGFDANMLVDIQCAHSVPGTDAVAPWMLVDDETKGADVGGPATVLIEGTPCVSQPVAETYGGGRSSELASREVRIEATLEEPFLNVGDTATFEDTSDLAGDLASAAEAGLVVHNVHWTDRESEGTAHFEGEVSMILPDAPVPLPEPHLLGAHALVVLTGKVEAMPSQQSAMAVVLDAPDGANGGQPPKVLVEWMPHWLSGGGGGLHCPPLPGDHVALLAESRPYGRVLYLGAHPSQSRLDAVRRTFVEEYGARFAEDRSAAVAEELMLKGTHLSRALVVGEGNVSVWVAAGAGTPEGAAFEYAAWQRLTATVGQSMVAAAPGKHATDVSGGDAVVGVHSDRLLALAAEENSTVVGRELVQVSSKTVDSESGENTLIVATENLDQKAKNIRAEAAEAHAVQCKELTEDAETVAVSAQDVAVSGQTNVEVGGGQVAITAEASGKLSGATLTIEGAGPTNVKGVPLGLN